MLINLLPKLYFGMGNAKIANSIATFSLPAGYTCPFAKDCLSKADRNTGKIIDGKHCKFRCFAASQECLFPSVRLSRWNNFELLKGKTIEQLTYLIQRSLPYGISMVRIHVGGDFNKESYFLAWLNVALNNPSIVFYGYTKATPWLVKYKKVIPSNFRFTASKGGTCDNLISKHKLKYAEVVYSLEEAEEKGLELDHDDSHVFLGGKESFGLLIHSSQPAGTKAAKAWHMLSRAGVSGYNQEKKHARTMNKPLKMFYTSKSVKYAPSPGGRGVNLFA